MQKIDAAGTIRQLANLYQGMMAAADVLEQAGSLEQAAAEANKAAEAAKTERDTVLAELAKARAQVQQAQADAAKLADEADDKAKAVLATTEAAAGRAPRRIALGNQVFPISAAIGAQATRIDVNLDSPVVVEPGTYLHVIVKMPLGTATASQVIRGMVGINGYWE